MKFVWNNYQAVAYQSEIYRWRKYCKVVEILALQY